MRFAAVYHPDAVPQRHRLAQLYTYIPGTLETESDFSLIGPPEYHCVRCGGHQGHRFDNWPVPSGVRYCNNGLALDFLAADGGKA